MKKMNFNNRRDQLSYLLGLIAKANKRELAAAEIEFARHYNCDLIPENVFEYCPFNDEIDQLIRSYNIYKAAKKEHLVLALQNALGEFYYLVSDFSPPCCDDGRAFYAKSEDGQVLLECDRCLTKYSLDRELCTKKSVGRMSKRDFISQFGWLSYEKWPYYLKLSE